MQDTVPERLVSLEVSWREFQARYERDIEAATEARVELAEQIKKMQATLAAIDAKEQQQIGMMRAAKIGWVVIGFMASAAVYIGLPRIGQFLASLR